MGSARFVNYCISFKPDLQVLYSVYCFAENMLGFYYI